MITTGWDPRGQRHKTSGFNFLAPHRQRDGNHHPRIIPDDENATEGRSEQSAVPTAKEPHRCCEWSGYLRGVCLLWPLSSTGSAAASL